MVSAPWSCKSGSAFARRATYLAFTPAKLGSVGALTQFRAQLREILTMDHGPILTCMLGLVHGLIGVGEKPLPCLRLFAYGSNADADRQLGRPAGNLAQT